MRALRLRGAAQHEFIRGRQAKHREPLRQRKRQRSHATRRQHQVSELDRPVIALEHDRPRRALVAVERTAGDAGDRLAVDDLFAVEHHRDRAADQGDFKRLPLAGLFRGVLDRRQEAVDAADLVAVGSWPKLSSICTS